MMKLRLRKVKHDGEKVTIVYERLGQGKPDTVSVVCGDPPAPGFLEALTKLRPHVGALCELDDVDWTNTLEIRGVSFSYSAEGVRGAVITALKPLEDCDAPLVLNTPHKPEEPTNEEMPISHCLTPACRKALDRVASQAWGYVDGLREQTDLFGSPGDRVSADSGVRKAAEQLRESIPEGGSLSIQVEDEPPVVLTR